MDIIYIRKTPQGKKKAKVNRESQSREPPSKTSVNRQAAANALWPLGTGLEVNPGEEPAKGHEVETK